MEKKEVYKMLKENGFDLMDKDNSDKMERELWRKDNVDIWIEIIEHHDNL